MHLFLCSTICCPQKEEVNVGIMNTSWCYSVMLVIFLRSTLWMKIKLWTTKYISAIKQLLAWLYYHELRTILVTKFFEFHTGTNKSICKLLTVSWACIVNLFNIIFVLSHVQKVPRGYCSFSIFQKHQADMGAEILFFECLEGLKKLGPGLSEVRFLS